MVKCSLTQFYEPKTFNLEKKLNEKSCTPQHLQNDLFDAVLVLKFNFVGISSRLDVFVGPAKLWLPVSVSLFRFIICIFGICKLRANERLCPKTTLTKFEIGLLAFIKWIFIADYLFI